MKRTHSSSFTYPTKVKITEDKHGTTGKPIKLKSNFYEVKKVPEFILRQYRIDFEPVIDLTAFRKKLIHDNEAILGLNVYIFDGSTLYRSEEFHHEEYEVSKGDQVIKIKVMQTGVVGSDDYQSLQVLNLIVRKSMNELNLQNVKRNFFDPKAKIDIPNANLELWPGYLTSIKIAENDKQLLNIELIHKFMRKDTIYSIARKIMNDNRDDWQNELKREVVGSTVLTDYTNKTYLIDDINFSMTPLSTFTTANGEQKTYKDYYKEKYNLEVKDTRQFLLVSAANERGKRAGQPDLIFLIPEFSRATGLTEKMRNNFTLMREISEYTRLTPERRIKGLKKFNDRIKETPKAIAVYNDWQMELDRNLFTCSARQLESEHILFGRGMTERPNHKAEWSIRGRTSMLRSIVCTRWIYLYPQSMERESENFLKELKDAAEKMNFDLRDPLKRGILDDRQETFVQEIDEVAQKKPNFILVVLPTNRADRYSTIKRNLVVKYGIPSQVVVKNKAVTTRNVQSIASKVIIQINCKLGGIPWMVKIPPSGVMFVGFDVSHHPRDKSKSIGALVATMDLKEFTNNDYEPKFYSVTMSYKDGNAMVKQMEVHLQKAIEKYANIYGTPPERIVFYRDGIGEGQYKTVMDQEVSPIMDLLTKTQPNGPKLAYIIVNKRVSARFFLEGGREHANPGPGTVIDSDVTADDRNDFYLISHHVGQGTVAPTYFNIIYNSTGFNKDRLEILTYKLTHLFYNWGGTVRIPCVSQFAKKLAFLTSQSLNGERVHEAIEDTLYFL